jgi:hypothetical protein
VLDDQGGTGALSDADVAVRTEQAGTGPGAPFRTTVSWADDLDPTRRWFGVLRYAGSDQRTLLRIG